MAYREKGWGVRDMEKIEQCKGESWAKKLSEHAEEGCRVFGQVQVAKVMSTENHDPSSAGFF